MVRIAFHTLWIVIAVVSGQRSVDSCNEAKTVHCCDAIEENGFSEPTDETCVEIRQCFYRLRKQVCADQFFELRQFDDAFVGKTPFTDNLKTLYCNAIKVVNECLVNSAKTVCISESHPKGLSKYEVLGHHPKMTFGNPGCHDLKNYMLDLA